MLVVKQSPCLYVDNLIDLMVIIGHFVSLYTKSYNNLDYHFPALFPGSLFLPPRVFHGTESWETLVLKPVSFNIRSIKTCNYDKLNVYWCHSRVHKYNSICVGSFHEKKTTEHNLYVNKYKKKFDFQFSERQLIGMNTWRKMSINSQGSWPTNQFEGVLWWDFAPIAVDKKRIQCHGLNLCKRYLSSESPIKYSFI